MTTALYPIPSSTTAAPSGIVSGPGGLLWFTEKTTHVVNGATLAEGAIGAINPTTKAIVEYPIANAASNPGGIVWGPDGDLWFTDFGTGSIGQFDPTTHAIVEYVTPTNFSGPMGLTVIGGKIWFTEYTAGQIGAINPVSHAMVEFHTGGAPTSLALGADGNLYFVSGNSQIGQFNTFSGATTFFSAGGTITSGITKGPDGGLYFGTATQIQFGNFINPHVMEIGPSRSFPVYTGDSSGAGGPIGGIVTGPAGSLYYTSGTYNFGNPTTLQVITQVGSLDPSTGAFTLSPSFSSTATAVLYPSITVGPDGNLWFTTVGNIGEATIVSPTQSVVSGATILANSDNTPLAHQLVFVDVNGNGVPDAGEPSAVSGLDGSFTITGAPVGTFNVDVQAYPGSTTVAQSVTTTAGGQTTGVVLASHVTSILQPIVFGPSPFGNRNPNLITAEVTGLYNILLGRAPDAPGLAGWVNLVKSGTPFSTVVDDFLHGTAYDQRVVASDYQAYVGRAPSQSDTDAWAGLLRQGFSTEQVAYLMLTSDGFNSLHTTDASFVQALYNDLLGRQATDSEVAAWESYLAGSSRANVVNLFVYGVPAEQRAAVGFLDTIWNAPPDSVSIQNVVTSLQAGLNLSQIAAVFFDAPQYAAYANKSVS